MQSIPATVGFDLSSHLSIAGFIFIPLLVCDVRWTQKPYEDVFLPIDLGNIFPTLQPPSM